MQLFGSSGIRGILSKEFLQLAFNVGLSVGSLYRSVIVGCDTRTSSDALKHAFVSGLLSAGCQAWDAGVTPTPSLAYATKNFAAGAMITASHNPPEYNGIKLCNPDGSAFDSAQRGEIEELISDEVVELASWERMRKCQVYSCAIEEHRERVAEDFPSTISLKVVVDCGCGTACSVTPTLLRELGCEVVGLNCYPSGHFPRGIEPTAENLKDLATMVKALGADLGIAHDGDGDRMVVIDDKGRFVSGDNLLVIFLRSLKVKKVVTTVDASMGIEEPGLTVIRTRVGDAFVSEELRKGGDFGGEPSGAWIFPQISYCPDGIYAAAKIAEITSENKLSTLLDQMPSYPVVRGSFPCEKPIMAGLQPKLTSMNAISINTVDGVRLEVEDGWVLIRPSGTEPIIRLTAEAKTRERAEELYDLGVKLIKLQSEALA